MTGSPIDPEAFARLSEITGDDPAFLAELVDTYLEDGAAQVAALRAAASAADQAALVRPAHTLKSSSASIGALELAERCRTLEADARDGTVADMATRVEACGRLFADVRAALLAARATSDRPG